MFVGLPQRRVLLGGAGFRDPGRRSRKLGARRFDGSSGGRIWILEEGPLRLKFVT